jgi:hypothetical protein
MPRLQAKHAVETGASFLDLTTLALSLEDCFQCGQKWQNIVDRTVRVRSVVDCGEYKVCMVRPAAQPRCQLYIFRLKRL